MPAKCQRASAFPLVSTLLLQHSTRSPDRAGSSIAGTVGEIERAEANARAHHLHHTERVLSRSSCTGRLARWDRTVSMRTDLCLGARSAVRPGNPAFRGWAIRATRAGGCPPVSPLTGGVDCSVLGSDRQLERGSCWPPRGSPIKLHVCTNDFCLQRLARVTE